MPAAKPRPADKVPTGGKATAPATPAAPPMMLGDLAVLPITIGTFCLLQEIDSPLLAGEETPIKMKDEAAAIYILAAAKEAHAALQTGREEFDRWAMAAASRVPAEDLGKVAGILASARKA